MTMKLNILFAEDSPDDIQLIMFHLEQEGFDVKYRRVDTEAAFIAALASPPLPDLILSDFAMPQFNGLRALRIVKERRVDVPFILVSGTIGEELAVDAIKQGADDYLMKDRLKRLGSAIQIALNQKRLRDEKTRSENALRHSEARYRNIFQTVPVSIWEEDFSEVHAALEELRVQGIHDFRSYLTDHPDFAERAMKLVKVLDVNETTIRLHNAKDKKELLGSVGKFVTPEEFIEEIIAFAEGKTYLEKETTGFTADGALLHFWMTEAFFVDEDGRYKALVSLNDISERKRAEQALRDSEKRFRALIENSADAITMNSADGSVIYQSPAAQRILGHVQDESMGVNPFDFVHPDDQEKTSEVLSEILQHPSQAVTVQNRVRHKDGSWRWIETTVTNLLNEPSVQAIVGNFRDITERKLAEAEILRHISELQALYENGLAINRLLNPREIGEQIIETFARYLSWHHVTIRLRKEQSDELELIAFNVLDFRKEEKVEVERKFNSIIKVGQGLSGSVAQSGIPVRTGNLLENPQFVKIYEGMQSGLYVPLKSGSRVIGVISVESREANAFSEQDERLLATLANQAAVAIENARLYQSVQQELFERKRAEKQIKEQLERLYALHTIDIAIKSSFDRRTTLNILLEQVAGQLKVDASCILIVNFALNTLEYASSIGFQTDAPKSATIKLGESYAGRAIIQRRMVQIENLADDLDNPLLANLLKGENFVSYYGVPLIAKGKAIGVLEVFNRSVVERDQDWFDFLGTLADQAAIAVNNAELFEDLQISNIELSNAYEATIEGWSRALDLRDKETEGHTLRVTEKTLELAQRVGFPREELLQLRYGALLHDIGKMGVPDGILLKPDTLTKEEWEVMRRHPTFAYELLSPIRYLKSAALDIPYCHHEKWDGTGYPRALKGEQIPLSARIFAIVDVWDAVTSDRPYRAAWTKEKALEYIREQSGKHFDPNVVKAFLGFVTNE